MEKLITSDKLRKILGVESGFQDIFLSSGELLRHFPVNFPIRFENMFNIMVEEGEARISIDLMETTIRKNSILTIQPRNFVVMSPECQNCKVRVIATNEILMGEAFPTVNELLPLLIHSRRQPSMHLTDAQWNHIRKYYDIMLEIMDSGSTPYIKPKIITLLRGLMLELADIHIASSSVDPLIRSRKEEIMARFIMAVSENFRDNRQVSHYAEKLCISPKHLSAVVKSITGRTAGDWIENYVVMEAKVLLKTTNLTVQEISDRLNFANQGFFGKYFKHVVGVSPRAFRLQSLTPEGLSKGSERIKNSKENGSR